MKGIIVAEKFKTQDFYKMISSICPELENSQSVNLTSER